MDYVLIGEIAALIMIVCWGSLDVFLKDFFIVALVAVIWVGINNNFQSDKDRKTFKLFSHENKGQERIRFEQIDSQVIDLNITGQSNIGNDQLKKGNKINKKDKLIIENI